MDQLLIKGIPLLIQQFKALLMKNVLLSLRNKPALVLRLLSPIFFLTLLSLAQHGLNVLHMQSGPEVRDPAPHLVSPPLPSCDHNIFLKRPCFDFVWSGNPKSARIQTIVSKIMQNNPDRPIPPSKVKSFGTMKEVDDWLFRDPLRCAGALHFIEENATVIGYGIQTNSSKMSMRGRFVDPVSEFQIPIQFAAEREIARSLLGDSNISWTVGLKEFAHPSFVKLEDVRNQAMLLYGKVFFLVITLFNFIFTISSVVSEKQLKLRQAMTVMGLYDTAYWLSWIMWEGIIVLLSSVVIVLFGMALRFDFFLNNSFVVVFLVFFLFQFSMMGMAFTLSTILGKASSATTTGYTVFIIFSITSILSRFFPYSYVFHKKYRIIASFFPPLPFFKALDVLTYATTNAHSTGISWSKIGACSELDEVCIITLKDIFLWHISTFFIWLVVAIYLDNILPNASGVKKSILYFLSPGYWVGHDGKKMEEGCCNISSSIPPLDHITSDDKDVREEESIVKEQAKEGVIDPNVAVQIRGLMKRYPGTIGCGCFKCCFCCCCCKIKMTKSFQAIKGLWVNFAKDQLFCLLGPNGAGKTTAISCLTGITPVTRGDALIYGHSIRSSSGMSNIRRMIGVCPQFDILWNTLSGIEHLRLFASIKGLAPSSIEQVAQKLLAQVRLTDEAKIRAGSYSGGMKRRLSVAVALIGDPMLIILDEPTSGMDPITRRHVWDVIEEAKKGRAIILTTHSMEEADILGDRIGIMAKGRLRCVGTSIRLKSRFGSGFIANLRFTSSSNGTVVRDDVVSAKKDNVKMFFKQHLNVVPKEERQSSLTFVIPNDLEGILKNVFRELQCREREFGVVDIHLSLTTLEEVFLNIAKKAELEMAIVEGNMASLTLSSGTELQIPVGARFVGISGTESGENPKGVMVEVYWDQDDSGALCISGNSDETPVPPYAQPKFVSPASKTLGQGGSVYGIVFELD